MAQHGWWQASDGNWYAPETHPDPAYRARFADQPAPPALSADLMPPPVPPVLAPPVPAPAVPAPAMPAPAVPPALGLHETSAPPVVDAPAIPIGMGSPPGMAGFGPPPGAAGFGPPPGAGAQSSSPQAGPGGGKGSKLVLVAVLAVMAMLAVAAVGAVVLLRGGGDGDREVANASVVTVERSSQAPPAADEDDADEDGPSGTGANSRATTSVAPARGSRQQPLALGETFTLRDPADGDVEVTINAFTADANEAMAGANQFNQPAPAGSSYTLVNATFTYRSGVEKTSVKGITFALSLSAFGVSAVEIPSYTCVAVPPDGVNILAEILDGGTVAGNTCFLMPIADATGPLLLRVQESWCFEDCDEYWIKLQ